MQNIVLYANADSTLAYVTDSYGGRYENRVSFTRGFKATLVLRLLTGENGEPYPVSQLEQYTSWRCVFDVDYKQSTTPILSADSGEITVSGDGTVTEIRIPISNMNTNELADAILDFESLAGVTMELVGILPDGTDGFGLQIKGFTIRNRILYSGAPTEQEARWLDREQVLALVASGFDLQFSSDLVEWHETQNDADTHFRFRSEASETAAWSEPVMVPVGPPGEQGFSPTANVVKSDGVTTITITDKEGTHTQTVKDGTNGTPGTPGADGKTPYLHLKYSDDGGMTFTADSGETPGAYIGTYTDFTEADSTSVSDYTWAKIKGEQGNPGKDGRPGENGEKGDTGIGIQAVDVLYRTASSDTELSDSEMPPNGWYTEAPTTTEGTYLWSCSKITYTDGTTSYTKPYCISVEGGNILNRGLEGVYSYMDERVESLSSTYVARSDFGTYREDINQRITTNSTKIEQQFAFAAEIQANTNRVEADFAAYKTDVEGYIRQGIVGYDGTIPIIGIAIGQDIRTTGTSVETEQGVFDEIDKRSNMAVWTTEKLSFYIGGQEAAYFSNGKLTVSQIATDRITGSGKWDVSFTSGVKYKWIGG